jgi:uncharacterized protein (TIGR02996 family)
MTATLSTRDALLAVIIREPRRVRGGLAFADLLDETGRTKSVCGARLREITLGESQ